MAKFLEKYGETAERIHGVYYSDGFAGLQRRANVRVVIICVNATEAGALLAAPDHLFIFSLLLLWLCMISPCPFICSV